MVSSTDGDIGSVPLRFGWNDIQVPLSRHATSARVKLALADCGDSQCGWGDVYFGSKPVSRPNLVFIVVDTMRADALGTYSGENLTPTLDLLASEGVLFERVYSQAPWTLPSTSSMLTGLWPSESPGWHDINQGIAPNAVPLAEIMRDNGYVTAAFVANALIADDNGFGRGFDTFWRGLPVTTPAIDLVQRAFSWINTQCEQPFFVYMHLMDPHDPYAAPPRRIGPPNRWPGDADPAFSGKDALPDPEALEDLRNLYLEEVRYADAMLGLFLEQLPSQALDNTLFVLTSDHGEEFMEHGFLKHGTSLFDELIHVPLIFTGPGCRRGARVDGIARLIDLVPTISEMLGLEVAPEIASGWRGVSLAGVIAGRAEMPNLIALSETASYAPLQWCSFDGLHKVVLFNRGHQHPIQFEDVAFIRDRLTGTVPLAAVYESSPDLPSDRLLTVGTEQPIERALLAAGEYVRGRVGGLWLQIAGPGKGDRIHLKLQLPKHDSVRALPFFWSPDDVIDVTNGIMSVDVIDDGRPRLAVVLGLSPAQAAGVQIAANSTGLMVNHGEPLPDDPGIALWFHESGNQESVTGGEVTRERLRALGYLTD
ncbi:MAG: sulfatase [Acidobacteriota bacterium]